MISRQIQSLFRFICNLWIKTGRRLSQFAHRLSKSAESLTVVRTARGNDPPESPSMQYETFVQRFRSEVSSLGYYNRRKSTIREMKVQSFSDALCFTLRLCGGREPSVVHHPGYMEFIVNLPCGYLSLLDKRYPSDSRVIARLFIRVPMLENEVSEIRFKSRV